MENKEIKQILENLIENVEVKDITLNENHELIFRDLDGKLHLAEPITKFKKEEIENFLKECQSQFEIDASKKIFQTFFQKNVLLFGILANSNSENSSFFIVKKAIKPAKLEDFNLNDKQKEFIKENLEKNIPFIIVGKNRRKNYNLINAMLKTITDDNLRTILIEDSFEIELNEKNKIEFITSFENDKATLLKTSLRLVPQRMIIDELNNEEIIKEYLKVIGSGHENIITSIRTNSMNSFLKNLASKKIEHNLYESKPIILEFDDNEKINILMLVNNEVAFFRKELN